MEDSLQQEEQSRKVKGCILPWMHLYGSLSGDYHLCCHAQYVEPSDGVVGKKDQSLIDVWNSDVYKKTRKNLLNNKIPYVCKVACYDKEKLGSDSNRLQVNKRFSHLSGLQNLTNEDGSLDVYPSYLDIRFGNLCNFKCRTCGPEASTSWYKDSPFKMTKVIDPYTDNIVFWNSLPPLLPYLRDVYFAGGEPFIQDGHYKLLKILIDQGYSKNINLQYNTNLSYTKYKKHDLISYWNNFKSVKVWPSCDGYGSRAEYNRSGLSWDTFSKNCSYFKKYISSISSVLSIFSITSMPDLILWCKQNDFDFYGTTLVYPENQSVTCLPTTQKNDIVKLYKKFVTDYSEILTSHDLNQIKSWLLYIKNRYDSKLLDKFKTEQQRLDKLRNESFLTTFPEYASWYTNI